MLRAKMLAVAMFLVAGILSVFGLNAMVADDPPNLGLFGKKVEHLRQTHHMYNVLFIGTSSIYRGIDPVALQRIAARNGCDVRAYNLGVSKLRLTELRYIEDRLPAEIIGDYDLIVLSPLADSGIEIANWGSSRIQYFTDWEGYKSSLIDIWEYPTTNRLPKYLYKSALLSGAFLYRQLGIGQLIQSVDGWPQSGADNPAGDIFDGGAIVDFSRHGFVALDDEPHEHFKRRNRGISENPGYFERLKVTAPDIRKFQGPVAERAWRRYARSLDFFDDLDVPMLMFIPPMVARRSQDRALADFAASRGMPLLNYNDVEAYPELFDHRRWFDYYHVNEAGAAAISERLGNDICAFVGREG